jgi:predicted transcriptional regulator
MQGKDRDMLRKMRRGLGIRQVWLAKQTGIYRTKLSEFESGHLELTADELQKVKDAVGRVVRERSEAGTLPPPHGQLSQDSLMQGKVVKQLRDRYGITQSELGRRCGLPKETISLFENSYVELDRSEQKRMGKALEEMISQKRAKLGLPPATAILPLSSLAGPQRSGAATGVRKGR